MKTELNYMSLLSLTTSTSATLTASGCTKEPRSATTISATGNTAGPNMSDGGVEDDKNNY
jgi:hypothetical protein